MGSCTSIGRVAQMVGVIGMIGLLARRHAERANQLDQGA
jgi:hypothetical protein